MGSEMCIRDRKGIGRGYSSYLHSHARGENVKSYFFSRRLQAFVSWWDCVLLCWGDCLLIRTVTGVGFVPIRATRSRAALPGPRGRPQGGRGLCHKACLMGRLRVRSGTGLLLLTTCGQPWGGPAWLLCLLWPGPRAVWRDRSRTHLCGLRGRTRSLRLRHLHGHWGGHPRRGAGGPKGSRWGAAPRSMATNYKVSWPGRMKRLSTMVSSLSTPTYKSRLARAHSK